LNLILIIKTTGVVCELRRLEKHIHGAPGLLVHPVHPTLADICGRFKKSGKKTRA
jgi:hypothetical protein